METFWLMCNEKESQYSILVPCLKKVRMDLREQYVVFSQKKKKNNMFVMNVGIECRWLRGAIAK
jgi:hypothetical protein